jgi:hypothetical protein
MKFSIIGVLCYCVAQPNQMRPVNLHFVVLILLLIIIAHALASGQVSENLRSGASLACEPLHPADAGLRPFGQRNTDVNYWRFNLSFDCSHV